MSDRTKSTDRTLPSIPPLVVAWALLALAWSAPWIVRIWSDVMSSTALGKGTAGPLDPHDVGEVVFIAAYGGIRLVGGLVLLTLGIGGFWFVRRRWRRRRAPARAPQPVLGD